MTATTSADATVDVTITAEDAPIGVQLWPTTTPQAARNFTLLCVQVITCVTREATEACETTRVVWTYENLSTREFVLGEGVSARVSATDAAAHNLS